MTDGRRSGREDEGRWRSEVRGNKREVGMRNVEGGKLKQRAEREEKVKDRGRRQIETSVRF